MRNLHIIVTKITNTSLRINLNFYRFRKVANVDRITKRGFPAEVREVAHRGQVGNLHQSTSPVISWRARPLRAQAAM